MKELPILMSAPMVRAILDGRKTQTRRTVKRHGCQCGAWIPEEMSAITDEGHQTVGHSGRWWCEACTSDQDAVVCPYGKPGDRLAVRETTCIAPKHFAAPDDSCVTDCDGDKRYVSYRADGHSEDAMRDYGLRWTPSIHVPRWASRITLEIVSVRVERLNDISEADAIAEGIEQDVAEWKNYFPAHNEPFEWFKSPIHSYCSLWESINGPGSWGANPWVWVVGFRRVKP